ncbi:Hpt domain-containing response regulator [Marilutibacter chinensis]|uniref:Response regulator n=1 Tax=Marilutibacter chinensis TaxID=2912247 RepID=A0ABS9HYP8_9GAMM|nr:response regulator [Lysobacter chinensis]MCF7223503.1 response regulator [Lysobacter chinensis]
MNTGSAPPRILLVEDDPTSLGFFKAALKPLDVVVETADCSGTALSLAQDRRHALWLFDAHLPDGTGIGLLTRLRAQGMRTPAVAHTASLSTTERAQLLAAGFEQVLVKPLAPLELQAAVRTMLQTHASPAVPASEPERAADGQPIWDDRAADRALNGNHQHVMMLRRMFLADLERTRERIVAGWRGDPADAHAELHKLRAACGFVGAVRLADAVEALQHMPDLPQSLERFERAVDEVLASQADDAPAAVPPRDRGPAGRDPSGYDGVGPGPG